MGAFYLVWLVLYLLTLNSPWADTPSLIPPDLVLHAYLLVTFVVFVIAPLFCSPPDGYRRRWLWLIPVRGDRDGHDLEKQEV